MKEQAAPKLRIDRRDADFLLRFPDGGGQRFLAGIASLTVVTNALNVALEVGAKNQARIILLGGAFNREASSTIGPLAEQTLAGLVVQKAFLGTQAFDLENGLTDTTLASGTSTKPFGCRSRVAKQTAFTWR